MGDNVRYMPELPEVETVRAALETALVGHELVRPRLFRHDVLCSSRHDEPIARQLLSGGVIRSVIRRGKHLALVAHDGRVLEIHLGMTGQVLLYPPGGPIPERFHGHVHARWRVAPEGTTMVFRDPRRFGGLWSFPDVASLVSARWSRLGVDALTITNAEFLSAIARTRSPIKSALLNQSLLAGVGNIYADEALFAGGVHPRTPACRVDAVKGAELAARLRGLLADAVRAGGTTLRDYAAPDGTPGEFRLEHRVYGRGGQSCRRCGVTLRSCQLAGRTTVYCPRCQPAVTTAR